MSWQDDGELGELPRLRINLYRAAVLFHNDIMAHRKTKPGAFPGWLGRKERIEYLVLYFGWNATTVVAYAYLYVITESFRSSTEYRLEICLTILAFALGCGIESVRDQIKEGAGDFLWEYFDHAGLLVEISLQCNVELRLLGPRAMIGEIETLIQQRVDVGGPVLAGAFARMQEHVFNDGIGALAVLNDLFEVAFQEFADFIQFLTPAGLVEPSGARLETAAR